MKQRRFTIRTAACSLAAMSLLALPALGQHPGHRKSSPLVDGKLMFVGRMPENIDSWIVADLRSWGKYKPTRNPEGVDLVMKAHEPQRRTKFEMRNGVPQPTQAEREHGRKRLMFTIAVTDWVTGRRVWRADILDRKRKKGRRETTTGSHSEIYARGLSTQQLAEEILRALRSYVQELASHPAARGSSAPPS